MRESHPADGRTPASHVRIPQAKTFAEREATALRFAKETGFPVPLLVDDMQDTVAKAYHALPNRLFILAPAGTVAYRGDRGPRGYDLDELERKLRSLARQ